MNEVTGAVGPSMDPRRFEPSSFPGDLASSARVLCRAPLLVLLTVVLSVLAQIFGRVGFVALPLEIVLVGFYGTQRVWFARLYGGDGLRWYEARRKTRLFIGPILALGLSVVVASLPLYPLAFLLVHTAPLGVVIAVDIVYGLVLDVALTFVVPALALTTDSVSTAWRIGLRMIKQTWPTCAWYVLTPGLTIVVLAQAFRPRGSDIAVGIAIAAATSTVALWFKGAIVNFYLRQNPGPPRT